MLTLGTVEEIEQFLHDSFASPASAIRSRADDRAHREAVPKPWGYEIRWAKTDRYVGKILHVNAGHALSLQYHNVKDETIYLYSGMLLYEIEVNGS